MLLKEEVADTTLGLARADAGARLNVDDCHPLADSSDDSFLQVRFVQIALNDLAKCYILHYLSGL